MTSAAARGSRQRRVRLLGHLLLLVGLLAVAFAPLAWERLPDYHVIDVAPPSDRPAPPPAPPPDPSAPPAPRPRPPTDDSPKIIRPEGPAPAASGGTFKFFDELGSRPPYVSNCAPIRFVIRKERMPAGGKELVLEGFQRVANVTGLTFRWDGFTDDVYDFNQRRFRFPWEAEQQALWVGWANDSEIPDMGPRNDAAGFVVGLGGPGLITERDDGQFEILGGAVALRADWEAPVAFGRGEVWGNVFLHEVGHAMGLDHVNDRGEQMYPSVQRDGPDTYGPGDTRALESITKACDR